MFRLVLSAIRERLGETALLGVLVGIVAFGAWGMGFNFATVSYLALATDLPRVAEHPDFALAVPTPDHFLPVVYFAGLAAAGAETAHVLVDGYAMGSLSMVSYTLGCDQLEPDGHGGAPALPDVPADETNI